MNNLNLALLGLVFIQLFVITNLEITAGLIHAFDSSNDLLSDQEPTPNKDN